jgi:ketosteroid isomerase-like protein
VRSIYADWELGDWSSATWAHPDIVYVMVDEPGSHVYVGLAEMARAWRSFLSAWEDYRIEPVEYRLLDGERVLVIVRAHGRGKSSGVELDESTRHHGANLFHLRDRRVARLDAYFDVRHAFADLGLTE